MLLLYSTLLSTAAASIVLSSLQPIVGFSQQCTKAYNTPIQNCDHTQFAPYGTVPTCSVQCLNELNGLASTIQAACQGAGAVPGTLIAHAFQGDLGFFLCGAGVYATSSATVATGTASNPLASSTAAASSTFSSSPSSTSADTTTSSSSTSTTSTSSSTISSTASSSSSTSLRPTTFTPSTTSSRTRSASAQSTSVNPGDSTPFDQTVPESSASLSFDLKDSKLAATLFALLAISSFMIGFL